MSSGVKTVVNSSRVPSSTPTPRKAGDISTLKTSADAVSVAGVDELEELCKGIFEESED
jgi:hypothetical protein